ncbi:aromatic ring-hydroxylating dioxygenase subunit alpha [Nannocystis sp. bb15-2]|uniref:Aromatic ring-hydroxylating dioxygenase subunit alpha n=2 Tax=Nannocystis bainbridge TaxID=2995303 RepID=A0ABT5DQ13_9BACT|nr:aromatic ring-hydroxylating dioxygenase subunit alpha [Nannocystis bainbridge]
MTEMLHTIGRAPPPSFEEARNKRQKVRAAGLDPNHWYAVEYARAVPVGKVVEVTFWRRSVAVFRGEDGALRAIDNRCAHRQLKLSGGRVEGCNVVCPYHGWAYGGDGKLCKVPHELFGKPLPKIELRHYPVRERYGLVWVFFGDPARADATPMPEIPELDGPKPWAKLLVDFTWKAHHSMIIDNVSDFTHAYLHRRFRPFTDSTLTDLRVDGDRVYVSYDTKVADGPLMKHFVDRKRTNVNAMTLCYQYPYQWSDTDGKIKDWCFCLPIDEQTTRSFFLFYFDSFKVPGLPLQIPRQVMEPVLGIAKQVVFKPLLEEDGVAVEAEQDGYNRHWQAPIAELNPAVHAFQALTIRKWEEYLATTSGKLAEAR